MLKDKIIKSVAACCFTAMAVIPAMALEYSFDAPGDPLYGRPTSDDTIYVTTDAPANVDRSKNAALIPGLWFAHVLCSRQRRAADPQSDPGWADLHRPRQRQFVRRRKYQPAQYLGCAVPARYGQWRQQQYNGLHAGN